MSPLTLGVICGLVTGAFSSITYLQSQHFVRTGGGERLKLLFLANVIQGVVSLMLLPFLWSKNIPPLKVYVVPLLLESVAFLLGQATLFTALQHTSSSRVAPVLGFKIPMVGLFSFLFFHQSISVVQWGAIAIAVAATWMIKEIGSCLSWKVMLALITTCFFFSISDLSIRLTIERLAPLPPLEAALVNVVLSYIVCGFLVLPLWYRVGRVAWSDVRKAVPYALTWLTAMGFLYTCFAMVNVVLGSILQLSRGLFSILLAPIVSKSRWGHLESARPTAVLLRQMASALLMIMAVILFILGRKEIY